LVTFVVFSRPGHRYDIPASARALRVEGLQMDVSSSAIRQQLAEGGRDVPLPASVLDYILMNRLYGASSAIHPSVKVVGGTE
ncbi:MAG: hypothetical protein MUF01_08670, partial [Bryobacterales bacterium]|nr:hypothetical protein [Bryobacterales bacterium]